MVVSYTHSYVLPVCTHSHMFGALTSELEVALWDNCDDMIIVVNIYYCDHDN